MPTDGSYSPPFNEEAALAELERLRDAIEESRRRRSQSSDEFEAFVRSFRTPAAPAAPKTDAPPAPGADVIARERHRPPASVTPPVEQPMPPAEERLPVEQPSATDHTEHANRAEHTDRVPPSKRRSRSVMLWALGGTVILVASIVLLMWPWKTVPPDTASSASTGGAPATASAPPTGTPDATPADAAPAAAPAANAHALEGELNVQRRVWVRGLVDGQRTVGRELPAGRTRTQTRR